MAIGRLWIVVVVDARACWHGGGRGSERSSELRRSTARCAATLSKTAVLLVAVASPGRAPIGGGVCVGLRVSGVQLEGSGG
jgi:hypothetical protein